MGALRGSDGAFICGVMADHTANAGRVYFAAGTPDRSDLRADGTVDLAGSLTRELIEETGLHESDYIVSDEWIVVQRWPTVAMMRHGHAADVPAEEGAAEDQGARSPRRTRPNFRTCGSSAGWTISIPARCRSSCNRSSRWSFDQR